MHNTVVPDKIKPQFVKQDTIQLQQADAQVVEVVEGTAVVQAAPVVESVKAAPESRSEHVGKDGDTLKLGQRVVAHGYQSGVVMYIGELESMPSMKGMTYIGIKLDKPEGSGDGKVNGVRYFECDPFCSVFVTPHAVKQVTAL